MNDLTARVVLFFVGVAAFTAVASLARWLGSCPSYDGQEHGEGSSWAPIMIGVALLVVAILAGCAHARRRAAAKPPAAATPPADTEDQLLDVGYILDQYPNPVAAIVRRNQFLTTFTTTGEWAGAGLIWSNEPGSWSIVWVSGGDDRAPDRIVIGDTAGRQVLLLRFGK